MPVLDAAGATRSATAILSVLKLPPGGVGVYSGELGALDLHTGDSKVLVQRRDAIDSLVKPVSTP
jgi:hypothetical protein